MMYRVVLVECHSRYVVWNQMFENGANRGYYFERGDYFELGQFAAAVKRFGERIVDNSQYCDSLYRDVDHDPRPGQPNSDISPNQEECDPHGDLTSAERAIRNQAQG